MGVRPSLAEVFQDSPPIWPTIYPPTPIPSGGFGHSPSPLLSMAALSVEHLKVMAALTVEHAYASYEIGHFLLAEVFQDSPPILAILGGGGF